jgi:hypothetical protein
MRVVLFLDTAQMRLPTSKMKIATMKLVFSGKYLYALPQVDWKDARVRKNADPYL